MFSKKLATTNTWVNWDNEKCGVTYWYQIFYTNHILIIWVVRIKWVLIFKSSCT